jgi:hypothetical protein
MTTHPIVGATVWEQEVYDHLLEHGESEVELLEEYKRLAEDERSSAAFRYIAGLLLDDERRHHQMFDDLAEAFRQMGEVRAEDEPIPRLHGLHADHDRILEVTKQLLDGEKQDLKGLKRLRKEMKSFRETTLWDLLLDLMLHDTEKHIMILEFVRDRARDTD